MVNKKIDTILIALFPLILTIGIVIIPVVTDYSDHLLAEESASQTQRWFWGHMISAIAFGFSILAAHSITIYLNKKEQGRTGIISLILVTFGAILYAIGLGADGVGPLVVASGGGRAAMFFDGSGMMVSGVFIAASILFGFGAINQAIGLRQAGLLKSPYSILAIIGAVIFMGASAIPSGWGLFIVAISATIIYLPISAFVWRKFT